jgi:hypothetical protein
VHYTLSFHLFRPLHLISFCFYTMLCVLFELGGDGKVEELRFFSVCCCAGSNVLAFNSLFNLSWFCDLCLPESIAVCASCLVIIF